MLLQGPYNYSTRAHDSNGEDILVHRGDEFVPVFQDTFDELAIANPVSTSALGSVVLPSVALP